jgi:3'-5' exoribonuclease
MSDRLSPARQLAPGDAGVGFFLCTSKEVRPTRNGDLLAVGLQDTTGQVAARMFDNVALATAEFDAGEFVKVQGRAQLHNGRLQLVLERIRRTMESDRLDGFSEEACIETAPRPLDEMWAELNALVAHGVGHPHLRQMLEDVLAAEGDRFRLWPAAVSIHHAYRGGLLEHVLSVATAARRLAEAYGADVDLVTAGAILHDIGKLYELDGALAAAYTREGNLVGHITIGAGLVDAACRRVAGFPDDVRTHLVHLIVSHHGERDHGSPVVPLSTEAYILAAADDLDAKLYQVRRAIAGDAGNGEFTAWVPRLDRRVWKGVATADAP